MRTSESAPRPIRTLAELTLVLASSLIPPTTGAIGGSAPAYASGPPALIAAAGDIACDPKQGAFNGGLGRNGRCEQLATSDLILSHEPAVDQVLALGDEQYKCGGAEAFSNSYDPSWGRFRGITHPAVGNHEYDTSGGTDCDPTGRAAGYFAYFGAAAGDPAQGYYSYDVGADELGAPLWRIVVLNGNCGKVGGCGKGSAQALFLDDTLQTAPDATCVLAAWHQPRFSAGHIRQAYAYFWRLLYRHRAELVLNGHAHYYQRDVPQDPWGNPDPNGIVEFIVGTGGESHGEPLVVPDTSAHLDTEHYGALFLALDAGSYGFQFVSVGGEVVDQSDAPIPCD